MLIYTKEEIYTFYEQLGAELWMMTHQNQWDVVQPAAAAAAAGGGGTGVTIRLVKPRAGQRQHAATTRKVQITGWRQRG
jgi:hypothetical protein